MFRFTETSAELRVKLGAQVYALIEQGLATFIPLDGAYRSPTKRFTSIPSLAMLFAPMTVRKPNKWGILKAFGDTEA